ncbi:MAG: NAD-dependent epimerase/dehydratase family protein [Kofleriaceae bacterium]
MRVLVLGGRGFFGSRVVKAFRARGDDVVVAGSRGGDVQLDVARIDASQLAGYDVVVNCADTLASAPDHLHRVAIEAGALYLEPTAEPAPIVSALERRGTISGPGVAVYGLGIFPGLSNLAARAAYEDNGREGPLEVAMQFSPFTAAGAGMVALIAHLMAEPAPYYEAGDRKTAAPFSRGKPMPFEGTWQRTLRAAIPETELLHASLGVRDVTAFLSPQPGVLMPLLRFASMLVPPWKLLKRAYLAMIRGSVGLLRRGIFRNRPTRVVISAVAGRRGSAHEGRVVNLITPDGVTCGAYAIAAAAGLIHERRPKPGTYILDELLSLDDVTAAMTKLAGVPELRIDRQPGLAAAASRP